MTAEPVCVADMNENQKANLSLLEAVLSKIEGQDPVLKAMIEKVREEGVSSIEGGIVDDALRIDFEAAHEAIDRVITAYVMELYKDRKLEMARKDAEIAEERRKLETRILHQCLADHFCIDLDNEKLAVSPFRRCLVPDSGQREGDDEGGIDPVATFEGVRDFVRGYQGEKGLFDLVEAGVVPQELAFIERGDNERAFVLDLIRWLESSGEYGRSLAQEIIDDHDRATAVLKQRDVFGQPLAFLAILKVKYQARLADKEKH